MGFVRVTAACHDTHVADPQANSLALIDALKDYSDSDVVVFGELSLTGYTCGDLFGQETLLQGALVGLQRIVQTTRQDQRLVVIGMPLQTERGLFNTAVAISKGRVLGVVPKQYLPNYQEFYESRWFSAADGSEPQEMNFAHKGAPELGTVPFGIDLLFQANSLVVGIELCEDLWMPVPPSSLQAANGANLLLNLSASNELVGKAQWREVLVRSQSGRCLAAYAYASVGPTESTTDLVFSGHCMIAENGNLLASSGRVGGNRNGDLRRSQATADIDLQHLTHDRQITTSWCQATNRNCKAYRRIAFGQDASRKSVGDKRPVSGFPFVPNVSSELHKRCQEVFGIQCAGLAKRIRCLPDQVELSIGVSGGLDSTLALLVATKTCHDQGWPTSRITGLTMPGFGTTSKTLDLARRLMRTLKIASQEVDIRSLCMAAFQGLSHCPFGISIEDLSVDQFTERLRKLPLEMRHDLVFENVQARVRTLLLMSRGFVLGTGDMSEQALGWSTYNGDHMSMYNVNCSVPKTLVQFLVRFVAESELDGEARQCLLEILEQPITPELLPPNESGEVVQFTEQVLGSYELHDFFLYHTLRFGTRPRKLLHLALQAKFSKEYDQSEIHATLRTFIHRFFANQFKRSCVPDGPKVGSVSLSPRGDWRMPSDAEAALWLNEIEAEIPPDA